MESPEKSMHRGAMGSCKLPLLGSDLENIKFEMTRAPLFSGKHRVHRKSSNRSAKTERSVYTRDFSSGSGGGTRMGGCGLLSSSWLEEGRGSLTSVGPMP